jgi:hypothetical protein
MKYIWAFLFLTACSTVEGNPPSIDESATTSVCAPDEAALIAGQTITAGTVSFSNTANHLHVTVTATPPWVLDEVHIWVGNGPPPSNRKGVVVPGQFPYYAELNGLPSYTLAIPLAELGAECTTDLDAIVHAVVRRTDTNEEQTAFGEGNPFAGPRWGYTMQYSICCSCVVYHDTASFDLNNQICWGENGGMSAADILALTGDDLFTNLAQAFINVKLDMCSDVAGADMVAVHYIINDCAVSDEEFGAATELLGRLTQ